MIEQLLSTKNGVNYIINSTPCIRILKARDICALHKITSIHKGNVNKNMNWKMF